jgi:hypothetical protein
MFYTYVATVCSKCFIYFQSNVATSVFMLQLQVFYLDVAYVAVANYTRMLQVYVPNFLAVIWMLHMLQWLYTYVASLCVKYFTCIRRILQQMLHVASVFISREGNECRRRRFPHAGAVPTSMRSSRHKHTTACARSSMRAAGAGTRQHTSNMQSSIMWAGVRTQADRERWSSRRTRVACEVREDACSMQNVRMSKRQPRPN